MGLGLMFGTGWFATYSDALFYSFETLKKHVNQCSMLSVFIAYFFNVIAIMGVAAIVIVGQNTSFFEGGELGAALLGGSNMVAMHLAQAVGGNLLLGFPFGCCVCNHSGCGCRFGFSRSDGYCS